MAKTNRKDTSRKRRKRRIRGKIFGTASRPRLTVFRSNKHIYAQVIDDNEGRTLAAICDLSPAVREQLGEKKKGEKAFMIGQQLAAMCKEKGITQVIFDRNGYIYHGRVKAVADGARDGGLEF